MRACPVCGRLYADEAGYCQADGQKLGSVSQVPTPTDRGDAWIGQLILDRYLVYRVVADGGMGRVYEALDQHERRQVALKVLHPEISNDEVSVERFKREYAVSRQLSHDHIVEVLDFRPTRTRDGGYILVMEFLHGEELRATLKREQRIAPPRAVRLVSQLAMGMDPAHEQGFIHRDLKPENVFLCQTHDGDVVKVLDFGSVKDRDAAWALTVMGSTIGSPFYMSPEQAEALDTLDQRSDVWACAAMIYEALTGELPFTGTTIPAILLGIISREPPPLTQAAAATGVQLPPALDEVIAQALTKDSSLRTPSVGAFADAFGAAFGLTSDHCSWASTPESQLAEQMSRAWSAAAPATLSSAEPGGGPPFPTVEAPTPPESQQSPTRTAWPWLGLLLVVSVLVLLGLLWT